MRKFFELLPALKLEPELEELFSGVTSERVVSCKGKSRIKIFIESSWLLPRRALKQAEEEISRQMFAGRIKITLVEHYTLSSQYTPRYILQNYTANIEEELEEDSPLLKNLFHYSQKNFDETGCLVLTAEDNCIIASKMECLARYLRQVFLQRFDIDLQVRVQLTQAQKDDSRQDSLQKEKNEISRILDHYEKAKEESQEDTDQAAAEKKRQQAAQDRRKYVKKKLPEDKNLFYGRNFEGEITPISEITDEIGEVVVHGQIMDCQTRAIKNEKTIVTFTLTDFTDSIHAKIFVKNEDLPDILDQLDNGKFIILKAFAKYDTYDHELSLSSVAGIKHAADFRTPRMDNSREKRVELHCHTTMSNMDAVTDVRTLINTARSWGHTAMAVTDHGVVQAFTEANHAAEGKDFKVIYGCEGYLVDDLKYIVTNSRGQSLDCSYVVFDIETTGLSAKTDSIIEIGAVRIDGGQISGRFSHFIDPHRPLSQKIISLTHITDEMLAGAPDIEEILPQFMEFCRGSVLVAHNADFDTGFIARNCAQQGLDFDFTYADTMSAARSFLPDLKNYKLDTVVDAMGCRLEGHHRAVNDAEATAQVFLKFLDMFREKGVQNLDELNAFSSVSADAIKKMKTFHVILLAKNEIGRINLYRLISASHIQYYQRRPRIPKSVLNQHREGLIIGSACEAGELFQALEEGRSDEEIARIVNYYDYLEIQPIGNNEFLIRDEKSDVQNEQDLQDLNRRIVALGETFDKPVCATCDVHFLNPEDEVYRRIIMSNKGFADADRQPPLYLRTTEEMLEEFAYLGEEKAREVVITNTNLIADMIDFIKPVRPDKCPPVIEDSDKTLREICYNRAHELYGENLPKIVTDRLEKELTSIISNGYSVMYIIAQKLVWKSVADGYLVGSRGSVGSSFVAYMAGITEVNSLQAHYLCPKCHYVDFDSDYVKSFSGRSGCDMEDRVCPVCGTPLSKEGHDIPFETFLGFNGDKEPDIDLNFSGDYLSKAHAYTEVIFGKGKTFRAGTVGTLADKTAYGYVMHYCEEHDITKRPCEIARLASGCVGVLRTTGQHPGGIIVLPHGEEINTFTPVQHPANDQKTRIITTHFDYHSIDHNLLKLDILGKDDPTIIRMLEDMTGVNATDIPMDDKEVLSLFNGLDALGIKPEDISGTDLGSLGIPEFGTDFAMQMLKDTKPTGFSDLVRIAGLAHGTDVWLGNAETLIKEGKCVISTAICTRDDIMIYLIHMGMDPALSFKIMEFVRKGKGLKPEWEKAMTEHGVPDWYIWSCKKIKYMFPKAHAAAYVMMVMRIAWFKIHIPLAYYAAYFTIRATAFDYAMMCQGKELVDRKVKEYQDALNLSKKDKKAQELTAKEKDTLRDLRVVQEFYARGFSFLKIDLYRSDAIKFQIVDGALLPPFSAIEGMGTVAAEALANAAGEGSFLSKEDIRIKSKVSQTCLDAMGELGLLGDLPQSNQLSIFDLPGA